MDRATADVPPVAPTVGNPRRRDDPARGPGGRHYRGTTTMKHLLRELDHLTAGLLELAVVIEGSVRDAVRAPEVRRSDLTRRAIVRRPREPEEGPSGPA